MSQSLMNPSVALADDVARVSPRMARFGVALIAVIVAACFAVLIAARAAPAPVESTHAAPAVDGR